VRALALPDRLRWVVLSGLMLLSGCGWFSSDEPEKRPMVAPGACPTATILRASLANGGVRAGQSRQQAGIAFTGLLSEVDAKCEPLRRRAAEARHRRGR